MRHAGYTILSRGPGWLEIETEDGPAILRGYNPAQLEYESVDEAREEKRQEIHRRAAEEQEATAPQHRREKAARDMARGRSPHRNRDVERLDAIASTAEELEGRVDAAESIEQLESIEWE